MQFSQWEKHLIFRLMNAGISDLSTARVMTKICQVPIFAEDIAHLCQGVDLKARLKARKGTQDYTGAHFERGNNVVSCILHHADLLRHHPRGCGELTITPDGIYLRPTPTTDRQSYCGSASATCLDYA